MNIENMTISDWLMIIGLGFVGVVINFLVTSFIKWFKELSE